MAKKGEITREDIKKAVEEVIFKNKPKPTSERTIVIKGYCHGTGGVKNYGSNMDGICNHPQCFHCRNFEKAYKEEIEKQIKEHKI